MDENLKKRLDETAEWLGKEYATVRTGQATPAILDSIRVEQYGMKVPLNQVGSVGIEDARTLRVAPWDASMVSAIEKAISDADLGVSVVTDSNGLRVIFPELNSERRVQLLKIAKARLEDARVSVRAVRDDVVKASEKKKRDGDLSEDEFFKEKERIQGAVDTINKKLEEMYMAKEVEINR